MRPRNAPAVLAAVLLVGCSGERPIDHRVGEIHLHQYATGAHLQALFIDPPTPIEDTEFDSTLPGLITPSYDDGVCKVFPGGACPAPCNSPTPIDAGRVRVAGLLRPVDLGWNPSLGSYEDLVTDGDFVTVGARAVVTGAGGGGVPAFSTELVIPPRLEPTSTLDSGLGAGFEASWRPTGEALRVQILLGATQTGPTGSSYATVSCFVDDALGRFRVPDAALALLPPAPRRLQLEMSRNRLVDVSLGDGRGIVVHGGHALLTGRSE